MGDFHAIELGGVRLELHYVGRNHSDNSLVMILPKDKLAFTVDFIPVESVGFRDFPDGFFPDWMDSLDRVVALDHGYKIAEGTFEQVATSPKVVEAYLGTGGMARK